ncbi:hypothetical protein DICPUDRAFT_150037 [Dictyostelium purpureum]|uniref:RRM domain-containing protein n=1 Tax=Dictyostelium purpureum TaxID=5786 RepID=F0ZFA7_DICPU|nr:uncharacterized protein DICPUDRAFT_150037 [Dictyostelium purpureum]EGC37373.1 hypothetical protein DICPUDRAFT_150037 [Dictyostelium purpureum]|eukprot:XP_003286114.1 hypothetical protein DICPUDRAFT_150037 [Dictyostelium purpureum]
MKSALVCDINNNSSLTITTNTSKNEQNSNNNASINDLNTEMDCVEYSVCAMFSIYYPMIQNFNNFNLNDNNKEQINNNNNNQQQQQQQQQQNYNIIDTNSCIPKITAPISWSEITESESYYSTSPSSSVYSFSEDDISGNTQETNKNKNNKNLVKKQVNNSCKTKKVFVGGITFNDIENDENLKKLRIQKIVHLFQSFGMVSKTNFHWNKGFFFIIYSNSKVAQTVVQSFSSFKKKQKYIDTIKDQLLKEFKDIKATPNPNFYVRFPSNNK